MKKIIAIVVLAVSSLAITTQVNATENAPAQSQVAKAAGIWIDVRTPEEYSEGHISDAVNVPVDQIADRISTLVPNKDASVNLYCKLGIRAEQARKILLEKGYTNVTNQGGYKDLLSKGIR